MIYRRFRTFTTRNIIMKKILSLLLVSLLSFQVAYAQGLDAEIALAIEIANQLNSDNDPGNDVPVPTTAAAAQAIIAAAPAVVVQSAIGAVSQANPAMASQVAAAGAGNNSGVSVAAAAQTAGVSAAAVAQSLASTASSRISSGRGAGTGQGSSAGGGSPAGNDLAEAILANPSLLGDILPGLSPGDVALLIEVLQEGGTIEDFIASGPQ